MKIFRILIACILCFLLVACSADRRPSPEKLLEAIDFHSPEIICTGVDSNGCEYQVAANRDESGYTGLAMLTRDKWGMWSVTQSSDTALSWGIGGIRQSGASVKPIIENHVVYCGNDAVGIISPEVFDDLPGNVTVSVRQYDSAYLLYFISEDANELNLFNPEWLREKGLLE